MSGTVELHGIELLTRDVERLVGFYQKVLHAGRRTATAVPTGWSSSSPTAARGLI
ncbi:MAG: VOC family protein [Oscillospiraceae bacterium]